MCWAHNICSNICQISWDWNWPTCAWEKVAKYVICKANAWLKFLYWQAKHLNCNCRKLLCSALIQCLFDYASCSWFSGLCAKFKNKLQTTQNKMVHFITKKVPAHTLVKLNIRKLDTLVLMIRSNFFVYVMPTSSFIVLVLHILLIILLGCLKFTDTTQETTHLISDYQKSKELLFSPFFQLWNTWLEFTFKWNS